MGLEKDTQKVWALQEGLFSKRNFSPLSHKMLIEKVFQHFCGWFRVSVSFMYFV